jgi:taurine dioxygenase
VCEEINAKIHSYCHRWKLDEMVIWDNWRMLHSVSGCDPRYPRRMHRTTIKGDYGLGYFENKGVGDKTLEMTV